MSAEGPSTTVPGNHAARAGAATSSTSAAATRAASNDRRVCAVGNAVESSSGIGVRNSYEGGKLRSRPDGGAPEDALGGRLLGERGALLRYPFVTPGKLPAEGPRGPV